jgi:hypothetical protein
MQVLFAKKDEKAEPARAGSARERRKPRRNMPVKRTKKQRAGSASARCDL